MNKTSMNTHVHASQCIYAKLSAVYLSMKFIYQIFTFICQIFSKGVQFSSVIQSCLTFCDPMNCSTPGLPVHHQLLEFTQTHVHQVGDAIQPSHPLPSPSPPALNLSQHQSLFKWLSSSHQVAKVLEFQLQHQSFQWTSTKQLRPVQIGSDWFKLV